MEENIKILLVDDDTEDRLIMADAFNEIGLHDVLYFAENSQRLFEYLDALYAAQHLPSLIILDMNMPVMNGTQTLQVLKSDPRYRNIPVIIFSTSANGEQMQECMDMGAISFVSKPVTYSGCVEIARDFYSISANKRKIARH